MAGFKTFANGEVLNASDVNDYLMRQVIVQVEDSAERLAIPLPEDGTTVFQRSDKSLWIADAGTWHDWNRVVTPFVWVGKESGSYSVSNGKMQWDTLHGTDPWDMWRPADSTSRLYIPVDGLYWVGGKVMQTGVAATTISVRKNSGTTDFLHAASTGASGAAASPEINGMMELLADDYIELHITATATVGWGGTTATQFTCRLIERI